ncbi:MAG TPA: PTS sugar transporter subunit IIA, partial [Longimicrobiaceae bacterium]
MIRLTAADVRLGLRAADREEAIRAVGAVLVERGYIAPGYVESMLGRELQADTYLGSGIAIPHGMGKDRELIRSTGVCVAQVPDGVEWSAGRTVRLVVGIAARSDEHLGVLAALTDVLDDPALAERLARTADPAEVVAGLTRAAPAAAPGADDDAMAGARHVEVRLRPGAGLHARPATFLVGV